MKIKLTLFIALLSFLPFTMKAQLEKVIVETYYISDANDATDTTGGYLAPGSTTYRVYIDLSPGWKLTKLYGEPNHQLKFSSTDFFFNNIADGQTFAKEFPKNRLTENTVALDSWLTIGQATRISAKTYFGVLKNNDDDGSFIGGTNNDGGSAAIPTGLLNNNDPLAGIPLTQNDGMDTMVYTPSNWADYGILDTITGVDSTIFGSIKTGNIYSSDAAYVYLQCSGVTGVNADSNQVLVAQLTTKGLLSFVMNIEIDSAFTTGSAIHYVGTDTLLDPNNNDVFSRWLSFPYEQICGCPDANYIEYLADRDCDDMSLCQNIVIYGCLDSAACNYNPDANFHLSELCCYPGNCNDRDLDVVCPENTATRLINITSVYPNPANEIITLITNTIEGNISFDIYNAFGRRVKSSVISNNEPVDNHHITISDLENGLYIIYLSNGINTASATFLKN